MMDVDEATSILLEADPVFIRFRDGSRFWIQRVLLPIISTVGVFGNIATILVLTRHGMRTSTNVYLTALAVTDLIYLICVMWLSLRHYPYVNDDFIWSYIYSNIWPYCVWLADATTNTSIWLTVTFTVERYIAIAHPIKGRVIGMLPSRAKRMIIRVYLICFTTTITTPFEWIVEEKRDPVTNTSKYEIASSKLAKEDIYRTVYYWFTSITFVLLPLFLLTIFNSFLIYSFNQSQKLNRIMTARQKMSERDEKAATRELKITITLIAVVIMFLVCHLPSATVLIYEIFHATQLTPNEEAVFRAFGNIFNCLVALNIACNFLLYCAISKNYRRILMLTFCGWFNKPSVSARSKAFHNHQVEGPKGVQYTRHRHSSLTIRGNPKLTPLRTRVSSQKFQRKPSFPITKLHRKPSCYITTIPTVSSKIDEP